ASLGITEQTDAVVLVVSEENGAISLARGGKLIRNLDEESLREMLSELLVSNDKNSILSYFSPSGGGTGE
ncbi:MAG: diadenylate cyclase, partial [Clostridia bacterium]